MTNLIPDQLGSMWFLDNKTGKRLYYRYSELTDAQITEFMSLSTNRILLANLKKERAIRAAREELAVSKADYDLSQEVVVALMAEGRSRKVAEALVASEKQLLSEAKRLNII